MCEYLMHDIADFLPGSSEHTRRWVDCDNRPSSTSWKLHAWETDYGSWLREVRDHACALWDMDIPAVIPGMGADAKGEISRYTAFVANLRALRNVRIALAGGI